MVNWILCHFTSTPAWKQTQKYVLKWIRDSWWFFNFSWNEEVDGWRQQCFDARCLLECIVQARKRSFSCLWGFYKVPSILRHLSLSFPPSINKHKCVENYPNLLPKRMCLQNHFQYRGPQSSATIFRGDKNSPCISDQNPNIAYFFLPTENAPFYFTQFCLSLTLFQTFHSINVSFALII